jgi:hypothetical protein
MPSFPLMPALPQLVDSTGWSWERFTAPVAPSDNFWLGVDRGGNRWLTKLSGGFCAYREIVFARLAQAMGWSCQSSVFLRLDKGSAQTMGVSADEIHAAHWFMNEHPIASCTHDCAHTLLRNRQVRTVDDLAESGIAHLLDWPKSEFAAHLFGGNEPPGRLFTVSHEFVIIDSELMFGSGPCSFETANWWNEPDGQPSRSGRALALDVCRDFSSLSDCAIEMALRVPNEIAINMNWPVAPMLRESRKFADHIYASHNKSRCV